MRRMIAYLRPLLPGTADYAPIKRTWKGDLEEPMEDSRDLLVTIEDMEWLSAGTQSKQ